MLHWDMFCISCLDFRTLFYVISGNCAFIDAEHALDPALAESIGVKAEHMLLSQPDCGEQALGLADILIRSGSIDVVVVDSVRRMLVPSALNALPLPNAWRSSSWEILIGSEVHSFDLK